MIFVLPEWKRKLKKARTRCQGQAESQTEWGAKRHLKISRFLRAKQSVKLFTIYSSNLVPLRHARSIKSKLWFRTRQWWSLIRLKGNKSKTFSFLFEFSSDWSRNLFLDRSNSEHFESNWSFIVALSSIDLSMRFIFKIVWLSINRALTNPVFSRSQMSSSKSARSRSTRKMYWAKDVRELLCSKDRLRNEKLL